MAESRKTKKWLFNLMRIAVCIGAMWIVVRNVRLDDQIVLKDGTELTGKVTDDENFITIEMSEDSIQKIPRDQITVDTHGNIQITYGLKSVLARAKLWLFLVAVFVFVPGTFLQSKRFQWVLRTQGIHLSYFESLKLCYAGNFLNFVFAVGATAGDAFKMYSIARHIERKTEAVIVVILDRLAGLIGLVILVLALALFTPKLADFRVYTLGFLVVGSIGFLLYLSPTIRRLVPQGLINRIPQIDQLRRIDQMAQNCAKHKTLTAGAIASTLMLQVFCIGAAVVVAVALGFAVTSLGRVFEFYAYFGAGWFVATIPISIQGMGTVELAYLKMFGPYGSVSAILCLAMAARLLQLVTALPGGIILLLGAHHLPTAKQMKALAAEEMVAPASCR